MKKTVFKNALLVTPESVTEGDLACSDGVITGVGGSCGAEGADVVDCEGAWLIPGLVELHTDNLERYMIPRPKVVWPGALPAFFAHDAQIAASGITTVFDAMAVGEYFNKGRIAMLARSVDALERARRSGYLRADHFLHLRCELADPRLASLFPEVSGCPALRLLSLMDNTPGDRQWRDLGSWRTHYSDIKNWKDDAGFAQDIRALKAQRDACFVENLAMVLFGAKPHNVQAIFSLPTITVGGVSLPLNVLLTIGIGVAMMLCMQLFVKKTKLGKAMRAVPQDKDASTLVGINVNKIITLTFAIGSGLAAVAALMYCSTYPRVTTDMGSMMGMKAFIAAVLGGIGIIPGAMIGGILVGLIEIFVKLFAPGWYEAVTYGTLIVILLVKPAGILGKNTGEKV